MAGFKAVPYEGEVSEDIQKDIQLYEEQQQRDQEWEESRTWDPQYIPKNIGGIRDMMTALRGPVVNDWDDEELSEKWLSTMRSFEAGNSVTTLRMFGSIA